MCFQRSSEGIEGKSQPLQSGWKIVPQSMTGCRETPVAKFVVCSWHEQLLDVVGMRTQRTTTSVRQKMTVISKIHRSGAVTRACVGSLIFLISHWMSYLSAFGCSYSCVVYLTGAVTEHTG